LSARSELGGPHHKLPEGHGAVVALHHQGGGGDFALGTAPRRAGDFDILVNDHAVVLDPNEAGVLDLLASGVKARRPEFDFEGLRGAGSAAGVGRGRGALVAFRALGFAVIPALVYGA